MSNEINLSPDELLAELITPTDSPTSDALNSFLAPKKKGFLTRQFVCFSTPVAVVYFQGVITPPASGIIDLPHCMKHAKVRKLNNPSRANPKVEALLDTLPKIVPTFYTSVGKAAQLHFVEGLVANGVVIRPDLTLSRAYALSACDSYVSAMADFLVAEGYSSPEDYLRAAKPKEGVNTLQELSNALRGVNLDDWA